MNFDPLVHAELRRGGPPLWVSGTAYLVGQERRSPATWANYVRITNGAGATDPSADPANWRASIPAPLGAVKSIQRGYTDMGSNNTGVTSIDVTVAAVNPAKAMLNLLSNTTVWVAETGRTAAYLQLINATTVRVNGATAYTNPYNYQTTWTGIPASWELIEFY